MASQFEARIRNVTAVLGPTNTGKTHLALERMLAHESGLIGLPLRLLAREVYDKLVKRAGAGQVALITGEEKIKPEGARYWVSTVEAMPRDIDVDFLAIDEIQLCADPERGHTFTDRMLHARGRSETLFLGAQTMRDAIGELIPGANFISRPRLSKLIYSGQKKITRLPARTAVVAFSTSEVYALAELIRRQRGGAAVVLGALSPRTRNAQVELYQSGDVDYIVATDAIGMGLNLNVDHVAFASVRKFDGQNFRDLTPAELGQIGGRAGRHLNDGTFGVTGDVEPFDSEMIDRLESHNFEPVKLLQWRNRTMDYSSLEALKTSLLETPRHHRLVKARMAEDLEALETVSADADVARLASAPAAVAKLWEVCQVPDYRKISSASHAELVASLYRSLMSSEERIDEDWFAKQVELCDRTDGDIDTLANRIAHIRTWTFVANRSDWLRDPAHWQGRTRAIEDSLSDAMHECLTQRFVDQRTSALMKGMRDKDQLTADISSDGDISVENHFVGRLKGFQFYPDKQAEGVNGRATRNAAAQVVEQEISMRVRRIVAAKPDAFELTRTGVVVWRGDEVARLTPGGDALKPGVRLIADDDHLSSSDRERIGARVEGFVREHIADKLKPLVDMAAATDISGLARGVAFRLAEGVGALKRETIADEIKTLDQPSRAQLRRFGVRFGAFNIYMPMLLKPAAAELAATLWLLKHGDEAGLDRENLPEPPRAGLTSVKRDPSIPEPFYRAFGFHTCGSRVVRFDILERLADQIRPLVAWRKKADAEGQTVPKGATGDGGFIVTPEMMSILGCSAEELSEVLKSLGFRVERRPKPKQVANGELAAEAAATGEPAVPEEAQASKTEPGEVSNEVDVPAVGEAASASASPDAAENTEDPNPDPVAVAEASTEPTVTSVEAADAEAAPEQAVREQVASTEEPEHSVEKEASEMSESPESTSTAAEEDAEEFEEVWRPRRHNRGDHRAARGRDRNRQRRGGGAGASASQAAHGVSEPAVGASAGQTNGRGQKGSAEREETSARGDSGPGGDRGRQKGGRGPDGGHRSGKRPGGKRRDDRGPKVATSSPPRGRGNKGGVDPDSPFATLGALKDSLTKPGQVSGDDKKR